MPRDLKVSVPHQPEPVSAILEVPKKARALIVLAHGAGAGMRHPGMATLAQALHEVGLATFRFQFPYMERGSKRPDLPEVAVTAVAAAVEAAVAEEPKLPLFAGGRSFGGRMTTTAASQNKIPSVQGILCFGFPLHPAKQPSTSRAAHLAKVGAPMLFLQGTRDDLADLKLIRNVVAEHPKITLHVVEGADHGFGVLKSSGRTPDEVWAEVAEVSETFCATVSRRAAGRSE